MAFPPKKASAKGNPFASKGKAAGKFPAKKPGLSGDKPKPGKALFGKKGK